MNIFTIGTLKFVDFYHYTNKNRFLNPAIKIITKFHIFKTEKFRSISEFLCSYNRLETVSIFIWWK